MTATHVAHASEINTNEGPTGEFVEVLHGKVMDFGGNVLFKGHADACVRFAEMQRHATRLVPTATSRTVGIASADVIWEGTSAPA